jgi:PAS domain S-box-containing protein
LILLIFFIRLYQHHMLEVNETGNRLSSIMDNTPAVIFLKNLEGRYILINKRYEELFHISSDKIIGRTDFDIFPEDVAQQLWKNDLEILKTGHASEVEELIPQDDGIHNYISAKFPLHNDAGDIYAVCGIATDITKHKQVYDALQESQAKLSGLYEVSPLGIALTDMDGRYLEFNEAFMVICGYPPEELKKLDYWTLTPREYEAQEKAQLETLQQTGYYGPYEKTYRRKNGDLIPIRLNGMIVKDKLGQSKIWSIVEDITDSKKAEETLISARDEAESANTAKSEFLAVMSHEIRTPLNAILGMTEVAKETNHNPDVSTCLDVVERSGNNLLTLIEDILDLSHIEAGRLILENKSINLQEVTQEALEIHTQGANNKGLELHSNISQRTPDSFLGDKKRLRQVLLNLIGNAVKFTEQGKVDLLVSCPSPQAIQFSVSDSGIGVPDDKQKLIFDPFSQADSSNTRQHGGVGLGLAICRRLVDAMNGKIWVESEIGKGSTFHFSVPLSVEDQNLSRLPSPEKFQGDRVQESEISSSILLAEDLEDNAMVIKAYLKNTNHQLVIVKDGKQAVDIIQSGKKFDLILMDIQMPVMDGLEATQQIRVWEKENGHSRTPILALTSHAMNGDEEKSLVAGCNSHITKPVTKKKLLEMIDQFVK